jgi:hypothetical protein
VVWIYELKRAEVRNGAADLARSEDERRREYV